MFRLVLLPLLFISLQAHACFDGSAYTDSWNKSVICWVVASALLVIASKLRLTRKNTNLFLPIGLAILASLPIIIEIVQFGSGDCGMGLLEFSIYPIYLFSCLIIYELFLFLKQPKTH